VQLVLPPLVENGFLVRTSVRVEGPMTEADHVQELRLFSEVNPSPFIAHFYLSPQLPEARVETRIRLADTQAVWAVARTNKDQFWCSYQQVIVTLAACAG
jgi:sulfur-oxidizing protein SoxY